MKPEAARCRQLTDPALIYRELVMEGQRAWADLERISAEIPGYDDLKTSKFLRKVTLISTGENFFSHFPFLFADALPGVRLEQLRQLSLSALCFFSHALMCDELVDLSERPPYSAILAQNGYQARGWQLLAEAARGYELPWSALVGYYEQHAGAVLLECRDHRRGPEHYSNSDLFRVVARRCAMSKIITRALCAIGGRNELVQPLDDSLDRLWLVECMLDDWTDWKADLTEGRFTWFLTQACEGAGIADSLDRQPLDRQAQRLGRYIYGSGFLLDYLNRAAAYLEEARTLARSAGCWRWDQFLTGRLLIVHAKRSSVRRELQSLSVEHSRQPYQLVPSGDRPDTLAGSLTVAESARRAVDFVVSGYQKGSGFADFMTPHGCPEIWTSAYVGCALQTWHALGLGERIQQDSVRTALQGVARLLIASRQENGWAANSQMPADAETTAWCIRFLAAAGMLSEIPPAAVAFLEAHQREDGGFGRFLPEAAGPAFRAWTASSPDVSAVVSNALFDATGAPPSDTIRRGLQYLLDVRGNKPLWLPYWWEGRTFAAFHGVEALRICPEMCTVKVRSMIRDEIVGWEELQGCWGLRTVGKATFFETAHAVRLLLRLSIGRPTPPSALSGMKYLLQHQLEDGSWASTEMRRLPAGTDFTPWNSQDWKINDVESCGVLLRDHRHLFTTAAVLAAMADFIQIAGDHRLVSAPVSEGAAPLQETVTV